MSDITKTFAKFENMIGNKINVSMFGRISNYYTSDNTADIEVMSNDLITDKPYPLLLKIPIGIFSIGGYSVKVTPQIGDYVVLLFMDYTIDNFIVDGNSKELNSKRIHALEDAIALPLSINFLNNAYNATSNLEISNSTGSAKIEMLKNGEIKLKYTKLSLGENANKKIVLDNGTNYTTSKNIYAE